MSLKPDDDPPPSESVWELFRKDEPAAREIRAAYLRFTARRHQPLSALKLVRWLAVGFAAGLGVAFAANGQRVLGSELWRRWHPTPSIAGATAAPSRAPTRQPAAPGAFREPESAPNALPPPSAEFRPSVFPPHIVLTEPTASDPKWQRAAAALKAHQYDAAESSLREVERTGATGDRDAASLALAQVLLTRGRTVEARARLERLRSHASSAVVSEKAASLLEDGFSSAGRSSGSFPVPQ
ncbi:MAG TPA: hypothetical protein VGQ57_03355 [Polyangiaceae bacterium]|jgi:hypothetical protein|nr:hypothetical protein [Polyangiaceae bacterium]